MSKKTSLSAMVSALALAAGVATTAQAQGVTYLDEIILIGFCLPTEVMDCSASVSVIDATQIMRVPPSSVARILNEIPGVRVTESGIERITIRGEDSTRIAILIDGQRLSDHSAYGTPVLISPAAIERIEVVRGSSSVVSGNRAIGGVVNIITKRGADVPFQITTNVGYMSATQGYRASVNVQGSVGNFDYRLTYSQSDLGDRQAVSGTLTPSGIEDQDLSMHLGYETGNHYFGFRAQDFQMGADFYTGNPLFELGLPQRDLTKYALFYEGTDLTPWMSSLKVDAFTQSVDRLFTSDLTIPLGPWPGPAMNIATVSDDDQTTFGFNAKAELDLFDGHRTIIGFEYENDRLITNKLTTTTPPFGPPPPPSTQFADATINTISVFAQHEVELGDRLTATLGGRYYDVTSDLNIYRVNGVDQPAATNSDSRLLGAVGLVFKPEGDITLRSSISQGYSYPSLPQLYLSTTAGGGTTLGNPDLNPETSISYEIGARLDRDALTLDATLFYTDATDYIARLATGNPSEFQYQNVSAAKSWGAELGAEIYSNIWNLRPYVSLAYVNREFTYENGFSTSDSGTPGFSGSVGVRRDWIFGNISGELDLFVSGESAATLRDSNGLVSETSDGYVTLNLRGNVEVNENLSLTFEAGNLLNLQYQPWNQMEGASRNFSLFLNATF